MKKESQTLSGESSTAPEKVPARQDDPILAVFLDRLELKLAEINMTKSRLAGRVGISRNTMSQFFLRERRPSTEILMRIANELSVSIDYLVGRTDDTEITSLLQQERIAELVGRFADLTPAEQESVMNYIIALRQARQAGQAKN